MVLSRYPMILSKRASDAADHLATNRAKNDTAKEISGRELRATRKSAPT